MYKGREMVGLPVIETKREEEIGRIKDLLFDTGTNVLKTVVLSDGSLLQEPVLVSFRELKRRGNKVFIVDEKSEASNENIEKLGSWRKIRGVMVLDKEGIEIGTIEDIIIDGNSGKILSLEISTGLVNDLMNGRKKINIEGYVEWGEDNVIID